jgi:hypothetical protein
MISISRLFLSFDGIDAKWHHENSENSHVIYPMGKPTTPHLSCCQRFAVNYYDFTFGALDLQHLRLLQR